MAWRFILLAIVSILTLETGRADDSPTLSVEEIVNRTNRVAYYLAQDARANVSMRISDAQNRVRIRELTLLRRDQPRTDELANKAYDGNQKMYVYFHQPSDVNKMVFMVWKNKAGDDDRWLYLPALDLVKRIAASDKRTSFAGSDFYYEDVSGRTLDQDKHELVGADENYYIIKNTPVAPASVEFAYYRMYIHIGTFLPVQTEYFDKNGERYRIYTALKVDTIQGRPTVTQASMENLKTGSKTVVEYGRVAYDPGLPEAIFSERYLRRAPVQYLH